jgi:hypothetical protein
VYFLLDGSCDLEVFLYLSTFTAPAYSPSQRHPPNQVGHRPKNDALGRSGVG